MIDLVQYRTRIGVFAAIASKASGNSRKSKLSFKHKKHIPKSKQFGKSTTTKCSAKDEDIDGGQIRFQHLLFVVLFCLLCLSQCNHDQCFSATTGYHRHTIVECHKFPNNHSYFSFYGDVRSNSNSSLSVYFSENRSCFSYVNIRIKENVKNHNRTSLCCFCNKSEYWFQLCNDISFGHVHFIDRSFYNRPVILESMENCPVPGTSFLLGNKGMHSYNGNPPTGGLNLDQETINKQRLCMLLVDGGSQALRCIISRIVLKYKLQDIYQEMTYQLCENDIKNLYPTGLTLPSLHGLSYAGLHMVWTYALKQGPVRSGTPLEMMIYDNLVSDCLDIQLKNKKQRIQELYKEKNYLSEGQWDILYPQLNVTVDLESFDITLLCFVILHVFQFKRTSGIWSQDPPVADVGVGDDILRLRRQRDELLQSSGMDNDTFQTAWTEIRDILVRLRPSQEFFDRIQQFYDCQVDPSIAAKNEQLIAEWKTHDRQFELLDTEGVERSVVEVENSMSSGNVLQRHREKVEENNGAAEIHQDEQRPHYMLNTVETWRKEDIYITKSVIAVKEKISSNGCVCVIGVPGAGKSTALHHAALSLETEGFIIYFISGPVDFLKYYDMNKKQVFVLDDALGVYLVEHDKVKLWEDHDENVRNALGTNTKLLVSIRTQILTHDTIRYRNIVFLDKSLTCTDHVDYSDTDYRLGIDDMRGMLKHYMTAHGVDIDDSDKVIRQLWPYTENQLKVKAIDDKRFEMSRYTAGVEFAECFPLLCKVFVKTDLKQNPEEFFQNPFPALTKVFQNIKTKNKHQFCALVLCTMLDGQLTEDMVSPFSESALGDDKIKLRNHIMSTYKLKYPDDLEDLQSALNSLTGVYISHIGHTYKISHAVFHDIVTYLINDPSFVFKYGTSQFIHDRVRLNKDKQQHDPYVIEYSDDTNIQRLADRMFKDLKSDQKEGARLIATYPDIDNDRLLSSLKSKLSEIRQTDQLLIETLFRTCMNIMSYTGDMTPYKLFEFCVQKGVGNKTQFDECFMKCMWTAMYKKDLVYKHGNLTLSKLIELCVQKGADCNHDNSDFSSFIYPLHISVMGGSLQFTELLLHNGADKRRVDDCGSTVLHRVCRDTKYNKLELLKLLTQHGGDQSVVKFVTSDRNGILSELRDRSVLVEQKFSDNFQLEEVLTHKSRSVLVEQKFSDNLQLEEVLTDKSIKLLTTDKHEIKAILENNTGKLQLVIPLHDNILTHVDWEGRNVLHWSVHDYVVTEYLLSHQCLQQDINKRDCWGRTPYWYLVNDKKPHYRLTKDVVIENKEDIVKLYVSHGAIL